MARFTKVLECPAFEVLPATATLYFSPSSHGPHPTLSTAGPSIQVGLPPRPSLQSRPTNTDQASRAAAVTRQRGTGLALRSLPGAAPALAVSALRPTLPVAPGDFDGAVGQAFSQRPPHWGRC